VKISLITPCRNAEKYIEQTIRSVLAQEGVDLEYFIQDGASTDGTIDIIRRYESQLAGWASEKDSGQPEALNRAFQHCTGEIAGFLNADDVLLPNALATVARAFAEHPEADIVYGEVEWIDSEGKTFGSHAGQISNLEEILNIYDVWWAKRQWVQPEVFFRRNFKDRVGQFDSCYDMVFDYEYWVRCFRAGARVHRVPTKLVQFRLHPNQKSTQAGKAADEIRAIVTRELNGDAKISPRFRWQLQARLSYDSYQRSDPAKRPGFLRALFQNPSWLWTPEVRSRLRKSFRLSASAS
jgi:glycosyltransferase involved in cell wall biosynthesis